MTLLITNVYQVDGTYYITCTDELSVTFTRDNAEDILGLPSWTTILADLIDQYGSGLEGKSLVVDTASFSTVMVVE